MNRYRNALWFLILLAIGLTLSFGIEQILQSRQDQASPTQQKHYQRIACMAPTITETVFALDAGSRVVGVSDFAQYPPEASDKRKLGGTINPNFEALLAVQPDLVITLGQSPKITHFCQKNQIDLLRVELSNIPIILREIRSLGKTLQQESQAESVCGRIEWILKNIRRDVAGRKTPNVFVSLFHQAGRSAGFTTAGGDTCLDQLIQAAGGRNIFSDSHVPYPACSRETLIHRNPDIIIEIDSHQELSEEKKQQILRDWQTLSMISAVRDQKIYFLTDEVLLRPGPRLDQAAIRLAQTFHPDIMTSNHSEKHERPTH